MIIILVIILALLGVVVSRAEGPEFAIQPQITFDVPPNWGSPGAGNTGTPLGFAVYVDTQDPPQQAKYFIPYDASPPYSMRIPLLQSGQYYVAVASILRVEASSGEFWTIYGDQTPSVPFVYTTQAVSPTPSILFPAQTELLTNPQFFQWTPGQLTDVTFWWFWIGSCQEDGGSPPCVHDYVNLGGLPYLQQDDTVSGLPQDGRHVYVNLWWQIGGSSAGSGGQYGFTSTQYTTMTMTQGQLPTVPLVPVLKIPFPTY